MIRNQTECEGAEDGFLRLSSESESVAMAFWCSFIECFCHFHITF